MHLFTHFEEGYNQHLQDKVRSRNFQRPLYVWTHASRGAASLGWQRDRLHKVLPQWERVQKGEQHRGGREDAAHYQWFLDKKKLAYA